MTAAVWIQLGASLVAVLFIAWLVRAMGLGADPRIEDAALITAARETLPDGPFDGDTWKAWTAEVKARTGAKGRALFMPLRLALTGLDHGPDLAGLLPLIGRERALARLSV